MLNKIFEQNKGVESWHQLYFRINYIEIPANPHTSNTVNISCVEQRCSFCMHIDKHSALVHWHLTHPHRLDTAVHFSLNHNSAVSLSLQDNIGHLPIHI